MTGDTLVNNHQRAMERGRSMAEIRDRRLVMGEKLLFARDLHLIRAKSLQKFGNIYLTTKINAYWIKDKVLNISI